MSKFYLIFFSTVVSQRCCGCHLSFINYFQCSLKKNFNGVVSGISERSCVGQCPSVTNDSERFCVICIIPPIIQLPFSSLKTC